jgi:hypothetical protein
LNSAQKALAITLWFFIYSSAYAQTSSVPTTNRLLNAYLRTNNPAFEHWDFGGQVRIRGEHKEYFASKGAAIDFAAHGDADNTYLLLREKVRVGYIPTPWLTLLVEGRDSSSQKDDRDPNPDSDVMDLNQAYIKIGGPSSSPLSLKVGRQELEYGEELLIGRQDFSNIPRSFDAAKLRYETDNFSIDAFTSRRVIARANAFNRDNDHELFSALYADFKNAIPRNDLQLYFIARNVGPGVPNFTVPLSTVPTPRDIYTVGGRVESRTNALPGWDYAFEGAYQFGRFKDTFTGPRLVQDAFATHAILGHTWSETILQPRIGIEYNFSSGDNNPKDRTHGTFDNLSPSNHRPFGLMDFLSWQNLHDACLTTLIRPLPHLNITNEVHGFWLADTHDYFYQSNGQPRKTGGYGIKPTAGQFVGTEYDFLASYNIGTYANLQLGYGHFFVGEYVRNSLAPVGGAKDGNWVYLQFAINF